MTGRHALSSENRCVQPTARLRGWRRRTAGLAGALSLCAGCTGAPPATPDAVPPPAPVLDPAPESPQPELDIQTPSPPAAGNWRRPVNDALWKRQCRRVKIGPDRGAWLSAYILEDPVCGGEEGIAKFEKLVGKPHQFYSTYHGYGAREFPTPWARALYGQGIWLHLAWEPFNKPGGLAAVEDDEYLNRWAKDAGACGIPMLLRFGAEFNLDQLDDPARPGNLGPVSPKLYRTKFRLVHDVMARHAPNVAMVWSLSHESTARADDEGARQYYPGNDVVDWIGVTFYDVPYHTSPSGRRYDARDENPLDKLAWAYHFAVGMGKPLMITEHSVANEMNGADFTVWAANQIHDLLDHLPRYPQVKCVNWFSLDVNRRGYKPKPLNYALTTKPHITTAYRKAIAGDWFLSRY